MTSVPPPTGLAFGPFAKYCLASGIPDLIEVVERSGGDLGELWQMVIDTRLRLKDHALIEGINKLVGLAYEGRITEDVARQAEAVFCIDGRRLKKAIKITNRDVLSDDAACELARAERHAIGKVLAAASSLVAEYEAIHGTILVAGREAASVQAWDGIAYPSQDEIRLAACRLAGIANDLPGKAGGELGYLMSAIRSVSTPEGRLFLREMQERMLAVDEIGNRTAPAWKR